MTTAAMKNLWAYIQGLNLSRRNEAWLAERLMESKRSKERQAADPAKMTREEFFARIEEASHGEGKAFESAEEFDRYIRSLS